MTESKHEIETSSEDFEKYCDACKISGETKLAIVYCETCKQFQCDACNGMHLKIPVMRGHSIVNIEDKTEDKCGLDMQGIDICEKHKEELKFYCKAEDQLCCTSCVVSDHLKCGKVGEIGEFTATNDEEIRKLQDIVQAKLYTSTVHQSTIPRVQKELRKDQMHKLQEIDNIKDKVIQLFDTFKAQFKSNTDKAINDTCVSLDIEMTSCKQLDEKLRCVEASLDDVTKKGTPAQVFTGLNVYKKQVDNLETSVGQDGAQLSCIKIALDFHQKVLQFIEMTDEIATMTVQTIDVFTPKKLSLEISSILKKSKKDKGLPVYSGLDFLPDGRIVAVDNHNTKCVVMDENLSMLGECMLEMKPLDITVLPDNSVAISYGSKLSLYAVNEDNTITHSETLQTEGRYFSLKAFQADTLVASTYNCDRPMKLVTLTGEEKDFDLPFPPIPYGCYKNWSTFIPGPLLETLVLTDRDASKCYLLNVKEKVKIVVEDDQIKNPGGVCATTSGHIFVCSTGTKSIVQISPSGKVLGLIPFSYPPYSIAVSHDEKQLLVFTYTTKNRVLQLYNIK